jgi:DNA (cytosine-5)-methyltransferase 1
VRERARLQGFPDSFEFLDTAKDAQRHVGNAVPVFVANAIAFEFGKAWVKALGKERPVSYKFILTICSQRVLKRR